MDEMKVDVKTAMEFLKKGYKIRREYDHYGNDQSEEYMLPENARYSDMAKISFNVLEILFNDFYVILEPDENIRFEPDENIRFD